MSVTTQILAPVRAASPVAIWHLLSLDAPTVAALWVWFIARTCHVRLPVTGTAAMGTAVWIVYVADRLLDSRGLGAPSVDVTDELEARHFFHHRHRHAFLIGLAFAAVCLAALLPSLDTAAICLYLFEGVLLLGWFVILHTTRNAHRLPKELAVGLFFSAAMFIPTVTREPNLRASLLPAALLFAALCGLNCLFIYAWEHESAADTTRRLAHPTTRLAVTHLPALALSIAVGGFALALLGAASAKPIAVACALAAGMLLALHYVRRGLSRNSLRAAADMALLTPILLIPFMR